MVGASRPPLLFLLPCALFALLALAACQAGHAPVEPLGEEASLGVAPFTNPGDSWELLADCPPSRCKRVDDKVVERLDEIMVEKLLAAKRPFRSIAATRQCQEIVLFEQRGEKRPLAIDYWLRVGRCIPVDYLLVPQLISYVEREGGEYGVKRPAGVTVYFYLLDLEAGVIAKRYVFDETQKPLTSDLLHAGKFFERGAKWVSAEELAGEAISEAIVELGL